MYLTKSKCHIIRNITTVDPRCDEVLGTMKIALLYRDSHCVRLKGQRDIRSWSQQGDLVVRGFCYIRPLYSEVPLYNGYSIKGQKSESASFCKCGNNTGGLLANRVETRYEKRSDITN